MTQKALIIEIGMPVNSEKALKKRNSNTFSSTDGNVKRSRNHYVCEVCNETFATNYILKKHTASVHEFEKSSLNDANSDFDSEKDPLDVSVDLSRMQELKRHVLVVHEEEKKLKSMFGKGGGKKRGKQSRKVKKNKNRKTIKKKG